MSASDSTPQELRDLFRVEAAELEASATRAQLQRQHAHQRRHSPELCAHLRLLEALPEYAGGALAT
jgi:hypothetical protein